MNSKKYEVNEKPKSPSLSSPSIHYKPNGSPSILISSDGPQDVPQQQQQRVQSQRSFEPPNNSPLKYQELRRLSGESQATSSSSLSSLPGNNNKSEQSSTHKKSTSNIASGFSSLSKITHKIFKKEGRPTILPDNQAVNQHNESKTCKQKQKTDTHFKSYVSQVDNDTVIVEREDNDSLLNGATIIKPFAQGKINQSVSLNFDPNMSIGNTISSSSSAAAKMDLKQKLNFLTLEEYVDLQTRGLEMLDERFKLNGELRNTLREEKDALNSDLVNQNSCIRSNLEIERLRGEIRDLANEKAILEQKYTQQSNWKCKQCTYLNSFDCLSCSMCYYNREDDEILICEHCGQKNALTNLSCVNCNACFHVVSPPATQTERERLNSTASVGSNSNNTSLNRIISNTGSTSSSNSTHNLVNIGVVQPSIPFIP